MKKDKKKSGSKRRSLLATGIASLALLATVATATYAWFSINTTVTVGVSSLEAVAGDNIDISSDGSSWGSTVSLTLDELNSTVTDISGDGKTFYTKAGNESTDYVEFTLQFRASSYYAIYLNSSSSVLPNATDLVNDNKSNYGSYTKDYIAGAVRVAFLYNDEVQLVWAPNSNYTLNPNTYALSTNDSSPKIYSYRNGSGNTDADVSTFNQEGKNFLATTSTAHEDEVRMYNDKNPVVTIIPETAGMLEEVEITVRIWLEGTDPECANPFLGGVFNTTLSFSADALTQAARPTITTAAVSDGGYITGYNLVLPQGADAGDYEVSVNNGLKYEDFDPNKVYVNQEVLVRKKATPETLNVPSSSARVAIGKKTQAAPTNTFVANATTRTLTSTAGYAPSAMSQGYLQYSTDGSTYKTLTNDIVVNSLSKQTFYIRYAANGDYEASESIIVSMLGKESKPIAAALQITAGTGQITIPTGYKYIIADSFDTTPLVNNMMTADGSQKTFTDHQVIAIVRLGDVTNTVDSDIAYFVLDFTAGTATATTGPNA